MNQYGYQNNNQYYQNSQNNIQYNQQPINQIHNNQYVPYNNQYNQPRNRSNSDNTSGKFIKKGKKPYCTNNQKYNSNKSYDNYNLFTYNGKDLSQIEIREGQTPLTPLDENQYTDAKINQNDQGKENYL